ncbi:MAG: hypothetical protein U7123_00265 [Potamolinea sp.]
MKSFTSSLRGMTILAVFAVLTLSSCNNQADEPAATNTQNQPAPAATTAPASPAATAPGSQTLGTAPQGTTCPANASIKGVTNKKQGKVYFTTKFPDYKTLKPEKCFADAASAEKAGYKVPK